MSQDSVHDSPAWPEEGGSSVNVTRRRFRWQIGLAIPVIGAVIHAIAWVRLDGDRTMQVMFGYYVWPAVALLMVLWWAFLSGIRWTDRLGGLAIAGVMVALFFVAFRPDGFWGGFVPRFAYRWGVTDEQRAAQFRKAHPPAPLTKSEVPAQLEVTAGDWPQFRGPQRDGIVRGEQVRRDWKTHPPKLLWRHPVGPAWSSFAIVGKLAFTQEQRDNREAVVCYNVETGQEVWSHSDKGRYSTALGGVGPRATPTVYDSRVYTLGALGVLNCFEAVSGKLIWSRNILQDANAKRLEWGMAGSPLVYDDVVVVNSGGKQGHGVTAYHRLTGKIVWTSGNHRAGYAAPRLAIIDGVRQIVVFDGDGPAGYDAATGQELWRFAWTNSYGNNIAQPIVLADGSVFVSSGYGTGSVRLNVSKRGDTWSVTPRWKAKNRFKLKFNGAVRQDHVVYGLYESILSCFDLETGKRLWRRGRYGYGQILLIDDLLLVSTERGAVVLLEVSPKKPRELGRFQAIEGKTWNHPALSRGRLLIRNAREAACFDVSPAEMSN